MRLYIILCTCIVYYIYIHTNCSNAHLYSARTAFDDDDDAAMIFIMQLEVYMYKCVCVYACAPRIYLYTSAVHLNFSLVSRRDFIMYARILRMYKGRIRYCVRIQCRII